MLNSVPVFTPPLAPPRQGEGNRISSVRQFQQPARAVQYWMEPRNGSSSLFCRASYRKTASHFSGSPLAVRKGKRRRGFDGPARETCRAVGVHWQRGAMPDNQRSDS